MSVKHLKSLLFKSMLIQQAIDREHQRRWPDWIRLLKLKKLRLAIKDRIEKLIGKTHNRTLKPKHAKPRLRKNRQLQSA